MGATRAQAEALADELLKIPPAVETKVRTPGATIAVQILLDLQNASINTSSVKDIRIQATRVTRDIKVDGGTQKAHAGGGLVTGPGEPRGDRSPALLLNGEYIVNTAVTARHLSPRNRLNAHSGSPTGDLWVAAPMLSPTRGPCPSRPARPSVSPTPEIAHLWAAPRSAPTRTACSNSLTGALTSA